MSGEDEALCPNCAEREALKKAISAVILGANRDNAMFAMVELTVDQITSTAPEMDGFVDLAGVIEHMTRTMLDRLEGSSS